MKDFKKIKHFLRTNDYAIEFIWIDKDTYGEIDYEKEVIRINIDLFIATVFVHEWLHDEYPSLSEKKILKIEDYFMKKLTAAQIRNIAENVIVFASARKRCRIFSKKSVRK